MDKGTAKDYIVRSKKKCFALQHWKELNRRDYTLGEMLKCIYDAANGSFAKMDDIIDHLASKDKVYGRTHVYGSDAKRNTVDLVRDENGVLQLKGYQEGAPLPLKGQHRPQDNRIFRKSDDQPSKPYQKADAKIHELGAVVREIYPNVDKQYIAMALNAIRNYAKQKKLNPISVADRLKKGKYVLDDDNWKIMPKPKTEGKQRKVIVITESDYRRLNDAMEMTEYKFHANIRHFISQLLQDPVNAQPPFIFKAYGYNRSTLLRYLLDSGIILKDERISDRDENGEPKTATMMVKYRCPKKNFDRKLEKLYIKLFEKNLPERRHGVQSESQLRDQLDIMKASPLTMGVIGHPEYKQTDKAAETYNEQLNEEGEGGGACSGGATSADASGQVIQPLDDVQRRKMPVEIEETTATTTVGDYQYIVPFGGDEETLARKNGKGGSVSVNEV